MVQHLLTESNSKDINRPSMTVEEEMMKYLVEKGGIWSSFIIASARQRFLGSFRSLVEAKAVFVAAYEQREEAKKNPSNVVKTWSKRNNRDIKLSDGAFLSDNFYETLDDKMLLEEIANILLPQSNANLFLSQWVTTHRQPPSYACLLGHEGWSVFLHHENCFLGRADDCEDSLLKDLCQQGENSVGSLPFSSSKIYPIYQISQDGSVAPEHAQLSWDTDNGAFKIRAIEPFIIYVNGKALDATKGYRKINNKDVVQIGSRSFFFLLPVSDRSVNTDIYLMKQMLLYTVLETIKIRAHFVKENAPISGIPTDSIFNHMLGLDRALQMIEEMENHVILEYSKRFDQKSFLNSGLPNDADEDVDDEPSESYTNSDRVKLQHDDADMDAALVLSSFASNGK